MTEIGFSIGGMSQTNPYNAVTTNEMYDYINDSWTIKKPMIKGRNQFGAFTIDNNGYAIGGESANTDAEKYDYFSNSWLSIQNVYFGNYQSTASSLNNKGYHMGGVTSPNHIEEYDGNIWTIKSSSIYSKRASSSFTLNNYIYACAERYNSIITERYDPINDLWLQQIGRLNIANSKGQSITLSTNNQNYGYYMGGATSAVVERYDDISNIWTYMTPFILLRYKPSAFSLNNIGYVNGGISAGDIQFYTETEEYEPSLNLWTSRKNCNVGRDNSAGFTLDDGTTSCPTPICTFNIIQT